MDYKEKNGNLYKNIWRKDLKESVHKYPSSHVGFARCMVTCENLASWFRMLDFTVNAQLPSTLNFARWSSNFARCEIVPQLDAVVFQRPYLPHFSSKSYKVWSVGFLTSWDLKWYISCRKWTSVSSPKVWKKTAVAVLCFLHSVFLFSIVLSLHTLNDFGKGYGAPKLGSSWIWASKSFAMNYIQLSLILELLWCS